MPSGSAGLQFKTVHQRTRNATLSCEWMDQQFMHLGQVWLIRRAAQLESNGTHENAIQPSRQKDVRSRRDLGDDAVPYSTRRVEL